MQDLVELVDVVATLEKGFAAEKLGENTAYRPDVDCMQSASRLFATFQCMSLLAFV